MVSYSVEKRCGAYIGNSISIIKGLLTCLRNVIHITGCNNSIQCPARTHLVVYLI
ncbi:hypothetical protein ES705_33997 [subsurface metagenome]